jgi:O-antigen ligase
VLDTARLKRHWLLILTVLLLPFSYVPHELIPNGPSVTIAVAILAIVTGARYKVLNRRPDAVDLVAILLAAYVAIRWTLIAQLEGTSASIQWGEAVRAAGTLIAGVALFRLGRLRELRPAITTGLRLIVLLLLGFETYQLAVGLPHLFALGYREGFYYFTQAGSYRPFGTFLSPTVFGAYLAMVGSGVLAMCKGRGAVLWVFAISGGLALTETRAAWLAFVVAMLVIFATQSREARARTIVVGVPILLVLLVFTMANPDIFAGQWSRLQSVSDSALVSNTSRLTLWQGVLAAAANSPLVGYAPYGFADIIGGYVGPVALLGHAHSNYLQILFMYGGIGLLLVLGLLVLAWAGVRHQLLTGDRLYAVTGLAALFAFITDSLFETTWTSLSVVMTLFLLIGLGHPAINAEESSTGGRRNYAWNTGLAQDRDD